MSPQRDTVNTKRDKSRRHAGTDQVVTLTTALPNDHVITEYLRAHHDRWRPGTLKLRRIQLRALGDALTPTTLANATEDDLYRWREQLTGAAPETLASYVSATRGLYRWMSTRARPRMRADDPSAILDRPKVPPRQPRPMLDRHFDLALACAVSRPEMYAWLGLAGCSGLRCCEIAWMQTTDVEEREVGALLHIVGKGGKRRTVPVGAALMETLRPFLRGPRGPVFTRPSDGRAHTPDRVSQQINDFLRELGVHETAHQLRHRFGTDYHVLDHDLFRQAALMGHASLDMTRRYTEVSPLEAARYIDDLTDRRLSGHGWWARSAAA